VLPLSGLALPQWKAALRTCDTVSRGLLFNFPILVRFETLGLTVPLFALPRVFSVESGVEIDACNRTHNRAQVK
jgi:hypothetical protein